MKVEDIGYCHGNINKVLDSSYMMAFLICDEDLVED